MLIFDLTISYFIFSFTLPPHFIIWKYAIFFLFSFENILFFVKNSYFSYFISWKFPIFSLKNSCFSTWNLPIFLYFCLKNFYFFWNFACDPYIIYTFFIGLHQKIEYVIIYCFLKMVFMFCNKLLLLLSCSIWDSKPCIGFKTKAVCYSLEARPIYDLKCWYENVFIMCTLLHLCLLIFVWQGSVVLHCLDPKQSL